MPKSPTIVPREALLEVNARRLRQNEAAAALGVTRFVLRHSCEFHGIKWWASKGAPPGRIRSQYAARTGPTETHLSPAEVDWALNEAVRSETLMPWERHPVPWDNVSA